MAAEKKTLADLLPDTEGTTPAEAIKVLAEHIQGIEKGREDSVLDAIAGIADSFDRLTETLQSHESILKQILARPDPVFPKIPAYPPFPEFPKPEKFPAFPEQKDLSPLLEALIEAIHNEHSATRDAILNTPIQEKAETPLQVTEEKRAKSAGGAVRRTAQWNIFTYPNLPGTRSISNPSGDGVTWYLDNALVSNSETVRLNGATPLSTGVDYTLSGNKILFVQNQTGSTIEVRGQNK